MPIMSYEPDPETAKLFATYKQAAEIVKRDKKRVLAAAEAAIRDHRATSPELVSLTGMSGQTFRTMAERLGVEIRVKPPTVGAEAEAKRAALAGHPEKPEAKERPSPAHPRLVADLSEDRAAALLEQAYGWATPDQRPTLDRAAADDPEDRNRAVVAAAYRIGVLTKSELLEA
jgi:hypothetical protein